MMKQLQSLVVAFSMYSALPMPHIEWNKENMRFCLCYFPLVGAAVGGLLILWSYLSGLASFGSLFRSVVFVLIPLLVTGGIHMDGFMDTVDAVSSHQPREKKLEILKDSHAGAFAILYCGIYLLAALGIWSEVEGLRQVLILAAGCIFSRALSGFAISRFTCAKKSGLVYTFSNAADRKRAGQILLVEAVASGVLMLLIQPLMGLGALAAGLLVFLFYRQFSYRIFGGITGDLAGFFLQMAELFMALAVMLIGKVL